MANKELLFEEKKCIHLLVISKIISCILLKTNPCTSYIVFLLCIIVTYIVKTLNHFKMKNQLKLADAKTKCWL